MPRHLKAVEPQLGFDEQMIEDAALEDGPAGPGPAKPTSGKESFLCPRCSAPFPEREALKAHLQTGHPPVPPASRPLGERAEVGYSRGGGE